MLSYLEKRKTNVCCRLHCFDISSHSYCLLLRLAWATTAQTSFEKLHFPAKITQKSQRPISHSNTRLRGGGRHAGSLSIAVSVRCAFMRAGRDEFQSLSRKIWGAATCWQCDSSSSSSCWDTGQVGCDQWCVPVERRIIMKTCWDKDKGTLASF